MDRAQALRLLQALIYEESLGVAGDEEVSRKVNQHFLSACLIAKPDLTLSNYDLRAHNMGSGSSAPGPLILAERDKLGDFLIEMGQALKDRG